MLQHHLVAVTGSTCLVVTLLRDEVEHVHTNGGMEDLEVLLIRVTFLHPIYALRLRYTIKHCSPLQHARTC
ncbi:hypothetical protein DPMN_058188 [Dreissena polymorpha]|uniref:Uncharacterized protein n=1 Tax=Dreissena polymorpha TaxID=45954 RepID=A0A9D4C1M2_DREPO|nr:hypothetical protein DPMN_058188 [Dreissena polymorpha]